MVQRMKWEKNCRIGIHDIDSQHRLLFAIANELEEINNPDDQGPEIRYVIDHIRKYVKEHFDFEEQFMESINYPKLSEHKTAHKNIIEEVNHTLTSSKNLNALKEQLDYLMNVWVKEHILDHDKQIALWHASNKKNV